MPPPNLRTVPKVRNAIFVRELSIDLLNNLESQNIRSDGEAPSEQGENYLLAGELEHSQHRWA
jgi:hypothetical protein